MQSSKNYEENGYGRDLDLLIIVFCYDLYMSSHLLCIKLWQARGFIIEWCEILPHYKLINCSHID